MSEKDRYWDCLDQAMEASHGGHTEEALAWLDEALKARPGGAEAHNGRGEILWDEGKIHEALQELLGRFGIALVDRHRQRLHHGRLLEGHAVWKAVKNVFR